MPQVEPAVYRRAFRCTATPGVLADERFEIVDVTRGVLSLTGYDYAELVGRPATVLAADRGVFDAMAADLAAGDSWEGGFPARTKDGDVVYGHGSTTPVTVDGETRGYVGIFVDTTKRREYERAAAVLTRLLRHDLRNDLNVVGGYLETAAASVDDDEVTSCLSRALDRIERVVHKSERAGDLQRLLEDSTTTPNRPVRLDSVLREQVNALADRFPEATFECASLPPVEVVADDLLSTVLEALLENGVTHNDRDHPTVVVGVDVGEETVTVRAADDGPGVPAGQREAVFGREEVDQLHHGTGLSLFFADRVVDSYDGDLRLAESDEGAEFVLTLRRA